MPYATVIFVGGERLVEVPEHQSKGVDTPAGHFHVSSGPIPGHDVLGYDNARHAEVNAHVGPGTSFCVGGVLFRYEERPSLKRRLLDLFVATSNPKPAPAQKQPPSPDFPLY